MTARPEVTHRKLNSTANPAEGELKFLVMATDGRQYSFLHPLFSSAYH